MLLKQSQNHQTSFHLQGDLDRTGIKTLRQLLKAPSQNLILNLKNVTSINAAGLSFLLKLQEKYQQANLRLQLEDLPVRVHMFLAFTGTISAFAVSDPQTNLKMAV